VTVKIASIDEIGEGELLDARRSPIRRQLLARNAFKQRVRDNVPTGPKRGCERLAGRSSRTNGSSTTSCSASAALAEGMGSDVSR
jgi:hypothetical protein